ncbi:MAG: glucoamylase family protein, partial [Rhodothermales bacterium]
MPFAPEETIAALRAMRDRYGDDLFTEYGFGDAFNPSFTLTDANIKRNSEVTEKGWFDHDYLGIDQGPILLMAENHRSGMIWEWMRANPYLLLGLERAGFTGDWLD